MQFPTAADIVEALASGPLPTTELAAVLGVMPTPNALTKLRYRAEKLVAAGRVAKVMQSRRVSAGFGGGVPMGHMQSIVIWSLAPVEAGT